MVSYSVKLKGNFQRINKKNGMVALFLRVIINGKVKTIGLNLQWPADLVDNISGTIKSRTKKDADYNDYMLIITNELYRINDIFKLYRIQDRLLTIELFNKEYLNLDFRKAFLTYMRLEIKARYDVGEISHRTYLNHMTTHNRLKQWKASIYFYEVDSRFLSVFESRLRKAGNNDNTIWTRIKDVITYLHRAESEGVNTNPDYKNYKNSEGGSSLIYLETAEINILVKLLNANKLDAMRQTVLKAFLFSCFTSLRISDVQLANWKWVNINSDMVFVPWKTRRFKRQVSVPLNPAAKMFIENKGGRFFHLPSDAEVNRSLKDITKIASLQTQLSTKIGRHTFGTHYYRHTKDLVSLQRIMGHSKIETTMVYVHANDMDSRTGMKTLSDSFISPEFDKLYQIKKTDVWIDLS